jgi:hypothetical protein
VISGIGIFIVGSNNAVTSCQCDSNCQYNLSFNLGGTGGTALSSASIAYSGGGGAGVGGAGAGNGVPGSGSCYTLGAGILITQYNGNAVLNCEHSNNNVINLFSNVGGAGGQADGQVASYCGGGGAGVGSGGTTGSVGAVGGIGTCYCLGGGFVVQGSSNHNLVGGMGTYNNVFNLCLNTGGAGGTPGRNPYGGSGGAGVGGGGSEQNITAMTQCYVLGGGIYVDPSSSAVNMSGYNANANNAENLCLNTGGLGINYGGAGVGGGGGLGAQNVQCFVQGGGLLIHAGCSVSGDQTENNNSANLSENTGGAGAVGGGAGVGGGGGNNGSSSVALSLIGGGIYLTGTSNTIQGCQCNANNVSNLQTNTGGTGTSIGSGVGLGGASSVGAAYNTISIAGIYVTANNTTIQGCQLNLNNIDNLLDNSSVTGAIKEYMAGVYLSNVSCNVVDSCDMAANVTCGIQLGNSDEEVADAANNLIMNCSVQGTTDCSQSTELDGLVSYVTTMTNLFENNIARFCHNGFVAQSVSSDIFSRNTAYNNGNQYVHIASLPVVNTSAITGNPASNITIP